MIEKYSTMRFTPSRGLIFILFILLLYLTWTVILQSKYNETDKKTCYHTEDYQLQLHKLTERVHHVLNTLHFTHFLCYGALWGQIRLSRTLPWEDNADFCLLNEEISMKDEVFILRIFKKHGLSVSYDSSEGVYTVTDNDIPDLSVLLTVFELDKLINMYRRIGWKRRVLPPDCESMVLLNCFPPRLIQTPLPLKEFGNVLVPVPREGIEIQKYHYRHNWWKEILPENCS